MTCGKGRSDIERMDEGNQVPHLRLGQRTGKPRHGGEPVRSGESARNEPEQVAVRVLQHVGRGQVRGRDLERSGERAVAVPGWPVTGGAVRREERGASDDRHGGRRRRLREAFRIGFDDKIIKLREAPDRQDDCDRQQEESAACNSAAEERDRDRGPGQAGQNARLHGRVREWRARQADGKRPRRNGMDAGDCPGQDCRDDDSRDPQRCLGDEASDEPGRPRRKQCPVEDRQAEHRAEQHQFSEQKLAVACPEETGPSAGQPAELHRTRCRKQEHGRRADPSEPDARTRAIRSATRATARAIRPAMPQRPGDERLPLWCLAQLASRWRCRTARNSYNCPVR